MTSTIKTANSPIELTVILIVTIKLAECRFLHHAFIRDRIALLTGLCIGIYTLEQVQAKYSFAEYTILKK